MKMRSASLIFILSIPILIFSQSSEKLYQQTLKFYNAGDYQNGIVTAERCVEATEKEFGKNHENYATSLNTLGLLYQSMGRYAESESLYVQAMNIYKMIFGEDNQSYAVSLHNLALLYQSIGKYSEAESLFVEAMLIYKKVLGEKHPSYAVALNNLAELYRYMGRHEEAKPLYELATNILKKTLGEDNSSYATSLNNLAILYQSMGRYEKAERLYVQAMEIRKKILGEEHPDYATTINNLAELYRYMGRYAEAEPLYVRAIDIWKKNLGEDHPNYAVAFNNLAILYQSMGRYVEAESLYVQAMNIQENFFGEDHPSYSLSLNNLAELYRFMGRYAEAEPLFVKSIKIGKKAFGEDHPDYALFLNNLASLYYSGGRYAEAEPLFLESMNIRKKVLGEEHPDYAQSLNNIAELYRTMGRYEEAEPLFVESMNIRKKILGEEHPDYAQSLNNIAELYRTMGRYAEVELLNVQAMEIRKKILGEEHPDYATSLGNLAVLYESMGRYMEAEPLYVQAANIDKKVLGEKHPDYVTDLNNLALLYISTGRYEEAEPLYVQATNVSRKNIEETFSSLSEKEQGQFLQTISGNFEAYQSFGLIYPSASSLACNSELLIKGLLLQSSNSTSERIWASGDTSLINVYNKFLGTKKMLAEQYSKPISERLPDLEKYEQQANELEKQMVTKASQLNLPGFDDYGAAFRVTWEDVQKALKPGEAAIEFSSFQYHSKKWTDSIYYCAYVILPNDTLPRQIFLFEERQLDSLLSSAVPKDKDITQYEREKSTIRTLYSPGAALYDLVWKKLELHLKGVSVIYYAPAGNLNKISFAAIAIDSQQTLSDKYNLVTLSSTRELTGKKQPFAISDAAGIALFGGVQYGMDSTQMKNKSAQYPSHPAPAFIASRGLPYDAESTGGWNYLEATLKEVQAIQALFKNNRMFIGEDAIEEAFKSLQAGKAPDVLHIATHGFFYHRENIKKDAEGKNVFQSSLDPLLRSGLVLAGANARWEGEPIPKNIEDGILTAKEVASMNLNDTKLVVLSACETGLGDIKGSEGVYGLQRAFKAAGADYLMMSLWKVPDAETQDFMTTFYRHCTSGKDIQTAFRLTQSEMKSKYTEPRKWAAFVLVR